MAQVHFTERDIEQIPHLTDLNTETELAGYLTLMAHVVGIESYEFDKTCNGYPYHEAPKFMKMGIVGPRVNPVGLEGLFPADELGYIALCLKRNEHARDSVFYVTRTIPAMYLISGAVEVPGKMITHYHPYGFTGESEHYEYFGFEDSRSVRNVVAALLSKEAKKKFEQ